MCVKGQQHPQLLGFHKPMPYPLFDIQIEKAHTMHVR